jgi:hypothetical protein
MQKTKLNRFIQKYNLGGNVNSVKWETSSNVLKTKFVSADKSLLGELTLDNWDGGVGDMELGIFSTDQLQKLLNVLGDDVSLNVNDIDGKAISLSMKNGHVSVDYVLSDTGVIGTPPGIKYVPDFTAEIKLDSNFIDSFVKGKSALSDVDSFTLLSKDDSIQCVIGYASTNTNRVNIPTTTTTGSTLENKISFDANMFREVLVANKECLTGKLEVSNEGLAKVTFSVDDFSVVYYLVAEQDND